MIRDRARITGKITATVYGPDGQIKRHPQGFFRKLFGIPGRLMISVNHNMATDSGDALIADLMSQTPARTKLDNSNAYIAVGTAYSGTGAKAQTGCHTQSGSRKGMQATFPKQKGAFGAANDNVVQYRAIFAAGDLPATTINEAALFNASSSGDCLAYGAISPDAIVSSADTLQVDWEITATGA